MGSDAYATGEALYALNVAGGMPATDPGYAKGVKYLLNTQAADALAPNSRAIVHCLGWQGEGVCPPAQPFGVVNAGRLIRPISAHFYLVPSFRTSERILVRRFIRRSRIRRSAPLGSVRRNISST